MVTSILDSAMDQYSWMDEETRQGAEARLRRLRVVLGPPPVQTMHGDVERRHQRTKPPAESPSFVAWLLENRAAYLRTRIDDLTSNSAAPLQRTYEPDAFLDVVPNAELDAVRHMVLVPAALLFAPFTVPDGLPYSTTVSYAALGSIVANLVARDMDPVTGIYDLTGIRNETWYTRDSRGIYFEQLQCIRVRQTAYEGVDVTEDDAYEVLSHALGLRMAYSAYHKLAKNESQPHSAGSTGTETPSSVIPTLGLGYTGEVHDAEQLFFAAYCLQLCGTVVSRNITGSLPLNVRCNLPLREVPEFGRAFNCPNASPMVSRDTCL